MNHLLPKEITQASVNVIAQEAHNKFMSAIAPLLEEIDSLAGDISRDYDHFVNKKGRVEMPNVSKTSIKKVKLLCK